VPAIGYCESADHSGQLPVQVLKFSRRVGRWDT
jgi:hypothetical protein